MITLSTRVSGGPGPAQWYQQQYSMVMKSLMKNGTSTPFGPPVTTPGWIVKWPGGNSGWRFVWPHSSSSRLSAR